MRLICPNCGAQYEVADDVIPQAGRDVQCSNCGNTWFEARGASEALERADEARIAASAGLQSSGTPSAPTTPEDTAPVDAAPSGRGIDAAVIEPDPADIPQPTGRSLDPEVTDILREEAAFEQAARKAEAGTLETQPDLGLTQDTKETEEARSARLAKLTGRDNIGIGAAVSATVAASSDAPRRELLPDIEEINSSLRPDATTAYKDPEVDMPPRRGAFRRGFLFIITLFVIAVLVYIFADQIAAAVPMLEGALSSYVDWVDGLRIALDQRLQGFINVETPVTEPATNDG